MFLKIKDLPVSQFMTAYPISVESNVSFKTVVDFMAERGFANVIITEKEKIIGVFTEREILKHIVSKDADPKTPIREIGKQHYEEVDPGISVFDASKIMTEKNSRLLIFAESKKLVGIITATDMLRAFQKTDDDPPIRSFISKNLAMCNSKTSIKEAAKIMLDKGIGSVIVGDFAYYGIFTERDVLYCLKENVSLNEKIGMYSSWPLIKSEYSVNAKGIAHIMAANDIKRLGITYDKDLIGIITAVDLINAYQKSLGFSHVSHWKEIK